MPGVTLGLDIGTTYCCVGLGRTVNGALQVEIVPSQLNSSHQTPSVVGFTGPDAADIVVGELAKLKQTDPQNCARTFYEFKRVIGRKYSDPLIWKLVTNWTFAISKSSDENRRRDDVPVYAVLKPNGTIEEYTAFDLYSILVRHLLALAAARLANGEHISIITVTVPAHFSSEQREHTKAAVEDAVRATMPAAAAARIDVRVLDEPIASVMAYTQQGRLDVGKLKDSDRVMVFDLGGGTLDVTVLRRTANGLTVCSTEGQGDLGGTDFDRALVAHVCGEYKKLTKRTLNKVQMVELRRQCEAAKVALTVEQSVSININGETSVSVTRAKFESLIAADLRRATEVMWKVLKSASIEPENVTHVVVVGGSSVVPAVKAMLASFFNPHPVELRYDINPTESDAMGAAIYGFLLAAEQPAALVRAPLSPPKPAADLRAATVQAVLNENIGFRLGNGTMHTLLAKNTPLPCSQQQKIYPATATQTRACVRVYQGAAQLAAENTHLGNVLIDICPAADCDDCTLYLQFSVSREGILSCMLRDAVGNSVNEQMKVVKSCK